MLSGRAAAKWILRRTVVSNESLTPEISLHLITEATPMWMATPESCPLPDPYWAFYWPGGQALTRFILDHGALFSRGRLLDFGSGCGSSSLAAVMRGACNVLLNDIDISSRLNFRLNGVPMDRTKFSEKNLLDDENWPFVTNFLQDGDAKLLLGDMFYDVEFTARVFRWLERLKRLNPRLQIFVGDPDRHPLADERNLEKHSLRFQRIPLVEYALPGYVTREHYGFTTAKVFRIEFE